MKNVLVTGANGHLGYNMARLLVEKGYKVRASVRDTKNNKTTKHLEELGVELVAADIMKPETLTPAVKGMDGVFQVAAVYTMISQDPQKDIIDPSIIGGINVLKAAKDAGVQKVVFTSSCAAIGTGATPEKPLTEANWNDDARSPYLIAKTQAEKRAWEFSKANNLNLVTICPCGIIGPGFYRHTPTTLPIQLMMLGKMPVVPPFAFSYVDVRDVAMAHLLAYENPKANGRYIVSDRCFSLIDFAREANSIDKSIKMPMMAIPEFMVPFLPLFDWFGNKLLGLPRQITEEMVADLGGKSQHVSSNRIRTELGWETIEFKQSLKDTLDWINKQFLSGK